MGVKKGNESIVGQEPVVKGGVLEMGRAGEVDFGEEEAADAGWKERLLPLENIGMAQFRVKNGR